MNVVGKRADICTARAVRTSGSVHFVPEAVDGIVAAVSYRPGHPCGYDVVTLTDGRVFERPDTYHEWSPYDWQEVSPPHSVREWIDQVSRAELEADDLDPPRLPSDWWILPGLMLAAFLFAFIASRLIAGVIE